MYLGLGLVIFILVQFANVLLSTIKSILTVNGGKLSAGFMNAMSYTFGAVVVKLITSQSFEIVVAVTFLTNIVGVYLAKLFMDKIKPVRLWLMISTVKTVDKDIVEKCLKQRDIKYTLIQAENERYQFMIYCYSKGETSMAKEILEKYKAKYTITEHRE